MLCGGTVVNLALVMICGTVEFEAKGYMYRENYPLRPCYDRVRHVPRSMIANQSISPSQQLQNPVQLPIYMSPTGYINAKAKIYIEIEFKIHKPRAEQYGCGHVSGPLNIQIR